MEQQIICEKKKNQVVLGSRSFLAEILDFIEDKALGYLMGGTEGEENIPLIEAQKRYL